MCMLVTLFLSLPLSPSPSLPRHLMMHVGSPKLLVISGLDQKEETEEEEVNFTPHVTPHEKLKAALWTAFNNLLTLLQLLGSCICRWRGRRLQSAEAPPSEEVTRNEGCGTVQSTGSLDHTPMRADPEITSEVLQMEMEAATPLPGENVTAPPVAPPTRLTPIEVRGEDENPTPPSHSDNPST